MGDVHVEGVVTAGLLVGPLLPLVVRLDQTAARLRDHMVNWGRRRGRRRRGGEERRGEERRGEKEAEEERREEERMGERRGEERSGRGGEDWRGWIE